MKDLKDHTKGFSFEEAKEQIRRNSPPSDYDVHYELIILKDGSKALKRVLTLKEKHD